MTTIFAYWNSRTCTTYVYQLLCWYLFVNYVTTMFHLMYLAIRKLEHLSASIHVVYNANICLTTVNLGRIKRTWS